MRWIFFSLVALNLTVLGFQWWRSSVQNVPTELPVAAMVRDAPETLVLLDELMGDELTSMLAARQRLRLDAEGEGAEGEKLCSLVGPFKALLPAEYFVEHLMALEVEAQVRQVEVPGDIGYWVYQSAQLSRKSALRRLHEFQAKGVDSYVIPRGEMENGISFGLFSQESGARERFEEIEAMGYEVAIKSVERTYEEIWVVLAAAQARSVDEELWLKLLNREEGLEMRQNFCTTVASE